MIPTYLFPSSFRGMKAPSSEGQCLTGLAGVSIKATRTHALEAIHQVKTLPAIGTGIRGTIVNVWKEKQMLFGKLHVS